MGGVMMRRTISRSSSEMSARPVRGKLEEALRSYERIIELDPQYAKAYLRIGMVCEEMALKAKP